MKRLLIVTLLGVSTILLGGTGVSWGQAEGGAVKARPPRFSPAAEGRPGYVNTVEYFLIEDPKAAARALLEEAALAQVDIDRTWPCSAETFIEVASGPFDPKEEDQLFARNAPASGDTICLIQMHRIPSLREMTEIMNDGVRVLKGIRYCTWVARVPFEALARLHENNLVRWVGVYKSSQKLPDRELFQKGQTVSVYSLAGDQREFRRDLEHADATFRFYSENIGNGWASYTYTIDVDPALLPEIAKLWWVERLVPNGAIRGGYR